jgi:hypothetical protein
VTFLSWNKRVFGLCPSSNVSKNTFWKLDVFLSSGKVMVAPTLLDPLERASLNHWTGLIELVCVL